MRKKPNEAVRKAVQSSKALTVGEVRRRAEERHEIRVTEYEADGGRILETGPV